MLTASVRFWSGSGMLWHVYRVMQRYSCVETYWRNQVYCPYPNRFFYFNMYIASLFVNKIICYIEICVCSDRLLQYANRYKSIVENMIHSICSHGRSIVSWLSTVDLPIRSFHEYYVLKYMDNKANMFQFIAVIMMWRTYELYELILAQTEIKVSHYQCHKWDISLIWVWKCHRFGVRIALWGPFY